MSEEEFVCEKHKTFDEKIKAILKAISELNLHEEEQEILDSQIKARLQEIIDSQIKVHLMAANPLLNDIRDAINELDVFGDGAIEILFRAKDVDRRVKKGRTITIHVPKN